MALYLGELIILRICTSEIWGAYFQGAFFFGGGGMFLKNMPIKIWLSWQLHVTWTIPYHIKLLLDNF